MTKEHARECAILASIILFAAIIRLTFMLFYPIPAMPDAAVYFQGGRELVEQGMMQNHIYMPLYPLMAYLSGGGLGQISLDILFSLLTIVVLYKLALLLYRDVRIARLAALAASVYPFFIFYSLLRISETSYTFFSCLAILLIYQRRYFFASTMLVLSILIRPTMDLLAPVLLVTSIIVLHQRSLGFALRWLLVYLATYIVLLTPWWIHNYHKYDEFVRLDLGLGHVFYAGNNPLNKTGGGVNDGNTVVDVDYSAFLSIKNPILQDRAKKQAALDYIVNHPQRFIELAALKFMRFWRLWPFAMGYQHWGYKFISLMSYGLCLLLSLYYLMLYGRTHWRQLWPILLYITYLTAVHTVTIGSIRYRFPLEPFIVLFACAGLVFGYDRYKYRLARPAFAMMNYSPWRSAKR